ncbi:hypothetical protein M231_06255 [Tremella mesenterica]|nr:hypothetical protein M231_06255 [Tremella mesenterica]
MAFGGINTTHKTVRRAAISWARKNRDFLEPFMEDEDGLDGYLHEMAQLGTWGDHIMLEALCRTYKVAVAVLKKTENGELVWIKVGEFGPETRFIPLYLQEEHYENLVSLEDVYQR